jgi:hypothetical protein
MAEFALLLAWLVPPLLPLSELRSRADFGTVPPPDPWALYEFWELLLELELFAGSEVLLDIVRVWEVGGFGVLDG